MYFSVEQWAAWAPGLTTQQDWLRWLATHDAVVSGTSTPALTQMPAMMRRRVNRFGKVALQAAYDAQGQHPPCPVIFASRYGDMARSVGLLQQLAASEPLSPTDFSMSVHNATGALFSIARGDVHAYTAIAAGQETVEAAFIEAISQLSAGELAVLVVFCEEPLPAPFAVFEETESFPRAWACRLARAEPGAGCRLQLMPAASNGPDTDAQVRPKALADMDILRFLVSDADCHWHSVAGRQWQWVRHGAMV